MIPDLFNLFVYLRLFLQSILQIFFGNYYLFLALNSLGNLLSYSFHFEISLDLIFFEQCLNSFRAGNDVLESSYPSISILLWLRYQIICFFVCTNYKAVLFFYICLKIHCWFNYYFYISEEHFFYFILDFAIFVFFHYQQSIFII